MTEMESANWQNNDNKHAKPIVEAIGRCRFIEALFRAGFEVAQPELSSGIDLIAYDYPQKGASTFVAHPLQLKVASLEQFSIERKYADIGSLIMVYVWHVADKEASDFYVLTYPESVAIGDAVGWTETASWTEEGYYTNNDPGRTLKEHLEQYRITDASSLRRKIIGHRD
jgi:hypothetical protein